MKAPLLTKLLFRRSVSLVLSFILTLFVYSNRIPTLQVLIQPMSSKTEEDILYTEMDTILVGMWSASIVCHLVEFLGLITGVSYNKLGFLTTATTLHTFGCIFLLMSLLDNFAYTFNLWCFVFFSYVPAAWEVWNGFVFLLWEYDIMSKVELRL